MNSKKILFPVLITGTLITAAIGAKAQQKAPFTKEISQEVPSQKGSLIRIVSSSRKVTVKSWDQPKVKVTLELTYSDSAAQKRSDAEWFENLGMNIKPFSNRVDILTGNTITISGLTRTGTEVRKVAPGQLYYSSPSDGEIIERRKTVPTKKDRLEEVIVTGKPTTLSNSKLEEVIVKGYSSGSYSRPIVRVMTIMVPTGCKLDIDDKYGDVVIGMNLDGAKLKISNGALDAQDIKDLQLTGTYCNANLGNVEKAEIEFSNGTFRAQNINDLDMDSKSSTIEYEKGNYLYMRSQADEYTIASIDKIDGRKVYGSIKIDQLNTSFDIEGNNADIKFRNISPEVTLIKINNRYADVRLPVKTLKNYYVDFIGNYSTVFAPFQKEVVKEEEKKEGDATTTSTSKEKDSYIVIDDVSGKGDKIRRSAVGEVAPRHFTSTVGDTKGKHTRIELTCHSCTVDFK